MADVQIDNGDFTRIANAILENVARAKLNGTQHAIINIVWRYTYGFQRCAAEISLTYLEKGTGYSKRQIQRAVRELIDRNILLVQSNYTATTPSVIKFNKNYDTWVWTDMSTVDKKVYSRQKGLHPVDKNVHPPENEKPTENRIRTSNDNDSEGEVTDMSTVDRNVHQERNIIYKDIIKNIVEYLNQKCGTKFKPGSETTKKHIKARLNEGFALEDFKRVIDIKRESWTGTDYEKYLRPQTLFGTKFEGYLNEKPRGGQANGVQDGPGDGDGYDYNKIF